MRIIYVLLVVLICFNIAVAAMVSQSVARTQGAATLRDSIMQAALQCCAVEGSYPSSIQHLENDYGLIINRNDYVVNYEWLGNNVPPSVVVKAR